MGAVSEGSSLDGFVAGGVSLFAGLELYRKVSVYMWYCARFAYHCMLRYWLVFSSL